MLNKMLMDAVAVPYTQWILTGATGIFGAVAIAIVVAAAVAIIIRAVKIKKKDKDNK